MEVLFIEYPKCSTCKKAKKWLDDNSVIYTDRHIVEANPTADELRTWWQASGLPLRRFFNTSGMLYREMNVKAQLDAGMSEDEALELLASNGMLVKRPLVVATANDGSMRILVGFKEPEWQSHLLWRLRDGGLSVTFSREKNVTDKPPSLKRHTAPTQELHPMQYRTNPKNGDQLSALGFGCMRLPGMPARIDLEATEKLILTAVDQGVNYLDTAYIYNGSEAALGEIFTRNPGLRAKVKLATKLPILKCSSMADFDTYMNRSFERLKVDTVDYYLIHNLTSFKSWEHLVEIGVEKWIAKQKEAGRIINIGFSYHGPERDFEPLLDSYAWDFCQIQYNYLNERYQAGTAGLKAAAARGIPVIIMEPLLGGKLTAPLPDKAQAHLTEGGISTNPVRLALRWLWDKPEVTVVLSGMNALKQLEENIATASEANVSCLSEAENRAIDAAKAAVAESYKIPCTGCGYCMPCPRKVDIPGCFNAYNASFAHGWFQGVQQYVTASGALSGKIHLASDCTQCGACVKKCPQHIDIPGELTTVKRRLQIPGLAGILKIGLRFIVR